MPGWRSLASRYCCIMGVRVMAEGSGQKAAGRRQSPGFDRLLPAACWLLISLVFAAGELAHGHRVARGVVGDLAHVMAHEHEAAAAGAFEVLGGGGVGDVAGSKPRPSSVTQTSKRSGRTE